jgi:hypothetical protein
MIIVSIHKGTSAGREKAFQAVDEKPMEFRFPLPPRRKNRVTDVPYTVPPVDCKRFFASEGYSSWMYETGEPVFLKKACV